MRRQTATCFEHLDSSRIDEGDAARVYAYDDVSEEQRTAIETIEATCARHGVPVGAAALQFSLREPRITATVCGVTKPERVEQTPQWAEWPIPDALWTELATLGDTQGT
jgi:D-threo-aldose 1-dehydrogenase